VTPHLTAGESQVANAPGGAEPDAGGSDFSVENNTYAGPRTVGAVSFTSTRVGGGEGQENPTPDVRRGAASSLFQPADWVSSW